jgi:triphosphatase
MEYEVELKLLTTKKAGVIIEKELLPTLDAVVTQQTLTLTNHYFDTSKRLLRQHDIGLRIRGNNGTFEQTLKTAGKTIGGLHQRPEYNVQLAKYEIKDNATPDLILFPKSAWPEDLDLSVAQVDMRVLFTTSFVRKVYFLEFSNGSSVELVWDLGEVRSGEESVPICEIELELKKGSTDVVFDLAKRIVNLLPTTIGIDSKAARGYHLTDGTVIEDLNYDRVALPDNNVVQATDFVQMLDSQLRKFQMLSAMYTKRQSKELSANIGHVLCDLVEIIRYFTQQLPCPLISELGQRIQLLLDEKPLIFELHDNNGLKALLVQPETTQWQLDLAQYLVKRI